jgi:hypothetical protein
MNDPKLKEISIRAIGDQINLEDYEFPGNQTMMILTQSKWEEYSQYLVFNS